VRDTFETDSVPKVAHPDKLPVSKPPLTMGDGGAEPLTVSEKLVEWLAAVPEPFTVTVDVDEAADEEADSVKVDD
jgi:hypothetical protein